MRTLTLTRPDDWHLHLRDGETLARVLPDTAQRFARAIVIARHGTTRDTGQSKKSGSRKDGARRPAGSYR